MNPPAPVSVAPMMDRTDRHFRWLLRQVSGHVRLYTEMLVAGAVLRGKPERLLGYDPAERPLALQLGGIQPDEMVAAARIAEDLGYDEVNLNVGCPSDRVQTGSFGACLMRTPERVADCAARMRAAVRIPITVKHRIGVDELDTYAHFERFVEIVAASGVRLFIVHARKAWLEGLSPKQNRTIPPLRYPDVYRLKARHPELFVEINGGIRTLDEVDDHLTRVDAAMIGRAAYDDPYLLADVDRRYHGSQEAPPSRHEVGRRMIPYAARWVAQGGRLHQITRHMLGLFSGQKGARAYRRHLSTFATRPGAGAEVLAEALSKVPEDVAGTAPQDLRPTTLQSVSTR